MQLKSSAARAQAEVIQDLGLSRQVLENKKAKTRQVQLFISKKNQVGI